MNVFVPPPFGNSTVTEIVAPGAYERMRTIALTWSVTRWPPIDLMTAPTGIQATSAPSPGVSLRIFAPIPS